MFDTEAREEQPAMPLLRQALLITAVALTVLLPGNRLTPLMDRDEPRFAQATVEMLQGGDWVVPHFNGDYRFDKPVMIYWLMSVSYRLLGIGEFAARLPAVLSTLLLALLLWRIAASWLGPGHALWPPLVLLTSFQFLINGRSASADMPMVLAVAAAQWALFELLTRERPARGWLVLCYGSLAFGFLVKGPIAWLVPLLSLLLHRFVFGRQRLPWRNLRLWAGLPLLLAVVCAWGIPALVRTHGLFWEQGMHKHVVQRGLEAFNGHSSLPVFYYLLTSWFSLFPWIGLAGFVWRDLHPRRSAVQSYLLSWFIAPYVIFGLYATQLPHYVLPGFPAACLLLGAALPGLHAQRGWPLKLFRFVCALFALVAVAALALGCIWLRLTGDRHLPVALGGIALLLTSLAGVAIAARRSPSPQRRLLAWLGVLPIAIAFMLLGAGLHPLSPATILRPLFVRMPAQTEFLGFGFREPSLVFYSNRHWEMTAEPDVLLQHLQGNGPRLAVVQTREKKLDEILGAAFARKDTSPTDDPWKNEVLDSGAFSGYLEHRIQGLNTARGTWVWLRVLLRPSPD